MLFCYCNTMAPIFGSFHLLCRCYKDENHLVTNPTGYNTPRTNHPRHHLQPLPHWPLNGGRVTATDFARALARTNHGSGPTVTIGQMICAVGRTPPHSHFQSSVVPIGRGVVGRGRGTEMHYISFSIDVFKHRLHLLRKLRD